MSLTDVLSFVTYKERLKDAEATMVVAYYDYDDNAGSVDANEFWARFVEARDAYKAVRNEVEEYPTKEKEQND